ncbi:MAG: bifunctional hydroxymethylpyrimidine kinase/phosphomethylpyrimidine kinase [Propionibacteriaceae bacterium]|jgi:hydroxyethylthiazole kinase-like uncharacterized protein yjeF|nr:bifunctional hydroxymethylpyrimidine kinase/phosphomethylpyrimidine kinase [Propionibacteriaceae bacterium]
MGIFSVGEIRRGEAEAITKVGDDALMQRAAHGLANEMLRLLKRRRGKAVGARVLILAGPGNNGGDALFAGVRLAGRGVQVSAVQTANQVHRAGWEALIRAGGRPVPLRQVEPLAFDLVLDGVLGIGGRPGLPPELAALAAGLPAQRVVAVDLPSGLPAEPPFTGDPHFLAGLTVTFGGRKPVHLLQPGREACGEVVCVDIGLPAMSAAIQALTRADFAASWPVPGPLADKYSRGVVGVAAGSDQYPGAGLLACAGAVHAGAGMVRYHGEPTVAGMVLARFPNVVCDSARSGRVDAWVLGPGWGDRTDARAVIGSALADGLPMVIDADGLRYLPSQLRADVVLTPHAGELARLLGTDRRRIESDPVRYAKAAADCWGATLLLKGGNQLVAVPGQDCVYFPLPGPAWTAQAGSGDTLAGAIGALLANGTPPLWAALLAASLQALTAAEYPGPVPPDELASHFRTVINAR